MASDNIGIPIHAMATTSDNQCLLVSCQDDSIKLIDQYDGVVLTKLKGHEGSKDYRMECAVLKGDEYVITGSLFGQAVIYDTLEAKEVKRLNFGGFSAISSMSRHPTNDHIIFACGRAIQLWSLNDHVSG